MDQFEAVISGEIVFPSDATLPDEAVAYVRLLDTSLADAPSQVMAEHVIRDIACRLRRGERIAFEFAASALNQRASYTVSAHVDADGADENEAIAGDYLTTQSYPVLTFGYPSYVRLDMQRVQTC